MSVLPVLTAAKVLRVLLRGGYYVVRQVGSHIHLKHPRDPRILVTIAKHNRDITRKLLSSILKQARLTSTQFLSLLGK